MGLFTLLSRLLMSKSLRAASTGSEVLKASMASASDLTSEPKLKNRLTLEIALFFFHGVERFTIERLNFHRHCALMQEIRNPVVKFLAFKQSQISKDASESAYEQEFQDRWFQSVKEYSACEDYIVSDSGSKTSFDCLASAVAKLLGKTPDEEFTAMLGESVAPHLKHLLPLFRTLR